MAYICREKLAPLRIIILTQYFPPETGAPQNRLFELAKRLQQDGCEIQVLTAMPNYPNNEIDPAYRGVWFRQEDMDGMRVLRSWIYVSKDKNSVVKRLLNYFSFTFTSLLFGLFYLRRSDILVCESPPLFLGITGAWLARLKGAKFVFNVSDLWPESVEKLGVMNNQFLLNRAYGLERWLYRGSALITGQTQGIVESISSRHPDKSVHWLPNSCDLTLFDPTKYDPRPEDGRFVCLYAGIIGIAQGLDTVLEAADLLRDAPHITLQLAGNGPELERLQVKATAMQLTNMEFLGGFPKAKMPGVIAKADMALVPLRKLDLFLGAIPSKIFENCAMEKPLLLGVEGEAKELFIHTADAGWAYEPENAAAMATAIRDAAANPEHAKTCGQRGRAYVMQNFERGALAAGLLEQFRKVLS